MRGQTLYSWSTLPRSEFEDARELIQTMSGRSVNIRRVTDDASLLRRSDQDFLKRLPSTDAMCCPVKDNCFDLWFNPSLEDKAGDYLRVVLLHELSHAYKTLDHRVGFKNFHGRALYHYGDLIASFDSVDSQVLFMLDRYTRIRPDETHSDYALRLKQHREDIREAAELEYDRVREAYGG